MSFEPTINVQNHIWGFGKTVVRPVNYTLFPYEINLFSVADLSFEEDYVEIKDDYNQTIYRFFNGYRAVVDIRDIFLTDSETTSETNNGSMLMVVNRLFPAINSMNACGIYPIFNLVVNSPLSDTSDFMSKNGVALSNMYIDEKTITIARLSTKGMRGMKISLKFIAKDVTQSLPLVFKDTYIIIGTKGGAWSVPKGIINGVEYKVKGYK